MAELKETYVVHGAETSCSMGLRNSQVVLRESHGVYLKQLAQITLKDCKGGLHVLGFGGCWSKENPDTMKTAQELLHQVEEEKPEIPYEDFETQVMDTFLNPLEGGCERGRMTCFGKCEPVIVSKSWDAIQEKVKTDGREPVMGEAKVMCKYGGVITIKASGQPEE